MEEARKTDLRIAKTRRAIKDAFGCLATDTDLNRITVKAIAEAANINRKTFYLHYDSIEALFQESIDDIMDDFFENHEVTPDRPEDIDGHAIRFFAYLSQQSGVAEKLICLPGDYDFGRRLYREQMNRYRSAGNPFYPMEEERMDLVLHFIRSTALDFYRYWVGTGKKLPAEEAGKLLAELTCSGIGNMLVSKPEA